MRGADQPKKRLWRKCLTNGADRRAASAVVLPLGPHALALQLALPLEVRLVRLVRVRVQCSDDAQHLWQAYFLIK